MGTPRLDVNFGDPAGNADPFAIYEEVRATGRVVWNGAERGWMVPGYDECLEVLVERTGPARFATVGARRPEATFWFDAPNMIVADGADHRRLRNGVARHFTLTAITKRWSPRVREVVTDLLAPLVDEGRDVDLIAGFSTIPVIVLAEMLGIPEARHADIRRWSSAVIGNLAFGHERPEGRRLIDEAVAELNEYMTVEIERHRREQPDDIMTVMVNMPDWSEAEIRSSAVNLLLAGYDTTAKLMGECLVTLEQHPDQRRLVAENLALVPNAVEEVLRWHGATQALVREVLHDTMLGPTKVKAGDRLYLLLGAANRDPSRWDDPGSFDVRRAFQPHLGFGAGPHLCLSAPLVRLELKVAFETLLRLVPEYRLGDIDYGRSFFTRGPEPGPSGSPAIVNS